MALKDRETVQNRARESVNEIENVIAELQAEVEVLKAEESSYNGQL